MGIIMSPKEPKHSIGFGYNYGDMQTPREISIHCHPRSSSESITVSEFPPIEEGLSKRDGMVIDRFLDTLKTLHFRGLV